MTSCMQVDATQLDVPRSVDPFEARSISMLLNMLLPVSLLQ